MKEFMDWLTACLAFALTLPLSYLDSAIRQKKERISGRQLTYHASFIQKPKTFMERLRDASNFGD